MRTAVAKNEPVDMRGEIDAAFRTGAVAIKSDAELQRYLVVLCSEPVINPVAQARDANRCLTINSILSVRTAQRIDQANGRVSKLVIVLAALQVVGALVQVGISLLRP